MGLKNKLSTHYDSICAEYTNGVSGVKLAEKYNCQPSSIYRILKKTKTTLRPMSLSKRKYNIEENVFDDIDTEEKAYWLGFLYADGYNSGKDIKLILQIRDKIVLEKLQLFLKTDKPIRYEVIKERVYAKFVIENKHINQSLTRHGCIKAKTHILSYPHFLEKNLNRHFIRGYFDGDGCIMKSEWSMTSTLNFLKDIEKIMLHDLPLKNKFSYSQRHPDRNNDIYTIRKYGKYDINEIFKYMYQDATVFLPRKYSKFEKS